MDGYPNGYKGVDLKSIVPWRTWLVGSNPTPSANTYEHLGRWQLWKFGKNLG